MTNTLAYYSSLVYELGLLDNPQSGASLCSALGMVPFSQILDRAKVIESDKHTSLLHLSKVFGGNEYTPIYSVVSYYVLHVSRYVPSNIRLGC